MTKCVSVTDNEMSAQQQMASTAQISLLAKIREDINCAFDRDPAARTKIELITTYPGIQAVAVHRVSHKLWTRGWRYFPRLLSFASRVLTNVDIHPGAQIGRRFFIDHGACVVIGETAIVGDDVTLYHGVTLGGTSWNKGRRHPELCDGVMVGAGAKILGAIKVGRNVRVGANSVVVQDVPDDSTVVGIPGKVVSNGKCPKKSGVHLCAERHGIDLDHHLIPDPVGKALERVLSRLDFLEQKFHDNNQLQSDLVVGPAGEPGVANGKVAKPVNDSAHHDCGCGSYTPLYRTRTTATRLTQQNY